MPTTTPASTPTARRASDLIAHAALDDDGNPLRPLEPDAPAHATHTVVAALQARPLTSLALATVAGALVAWLLGGRAA